MTNARYCVQCGTALVQGANFCTACGLSTGTAGRGVPGPRPTGALLLLAPWFVLAAVLLMGLGYFIGAGMGPAGRPAAIGEPLAAGSQIVAAPDISSLSPEERVDRLFNRVMSLAAAGKQDSVQFFAPMAINALAALMPLDAHRRYDLGLIQLVAGDASSARAQADTILQQQPSHLLGLALAMRAATAESRRADAQRLGARLTAAATSERAKRLPEYAEHAPDIAEALEEAGGRKP